LNTPENLLYTSEHEWIKIDGEIATIGVTDFAQSELGDIIFLEFPDLNSVFNKGDIFGTIEAVKTVSDLYMPIDGEICEINDTLNDSPEKVNEDPYKDGWMVKVKIDKSVSLDGLLDSNQYNQLIT
jgi:glycine cleavage system H protein